MGVKVRSIGPIPARIMIVGEAPGVEEVYRNEPFVGPSGYELNKMLGEAGISRAECFITNVVRERPPDNNIGHFIYDKKTKVPAGFTPYRNRHATREVHEGVDALRAEVGAVKPNIIIAFGNTPLLALTGRTGITKWRGSMLETDQEFGSGFRVIPTVHPAAVLREWSYRAAVVNDLKRAARFRDGTAYPRPKWNFIIEPTWDTVWYKLNWLLSELEAGRHRRLSFDLETLPAIGHISCAGISWSLLDAMCIPFTRGNGAVSYWDEDQESWIVHTLGRICTHPNAEIVGQNILYDSQYTWRRWGWIPRVAQDCMISQHSIFSDQPKALGYQASIYCDYYVYWKDEGKHWNPEHGERVLWYYNCEDVVYTDECGRTELQIVEKLGLQEVHKFQQKMFWPVLRTMIRGVKIDLEVRAALTQEVAHEIKRREEFLKAVLGHELNPRSPKQMTKLFYEDLKLPVQMTRAAKGKPAHPTLNDDALQKLVRLEPLVKPLVNCISDIRTLGIFNSTFLGSELDEDQRMRCSYNIGGSESGKSAPKTYRLSSSENAFGNGANLQNIPSEKSKSVGKAAARGGIAGLGDPYQFPNIRSMFIPDEGYTFFDGDLDRADLQVVAWEAEDELLKAALRLGVDIHLLNCFSLENKDPPELSELIEGHSKYWDHRGPRKHLREFAKVFCHGTNYVGGARTMAAHTGRTIADIDRSQKIWFGAHPGIKRWHERVERQVTKFRFVENRFGYRWYIFDRIDGVLPEAVAWIPQSTVSIVINRIWVNVYEKLPEVEVLLQVHDSLAGQFPSHKPELTGEIKKQASIIVPYEDPLIIPFGIKTSDKSWGDCK